MELRPSMRLSVRRVNTERHVTSWKGIEGKLTCQRAKVASCCLQAFVSVASTPASV
jgi:hypothetical protein